MSSPSPENAATNNLNDIEKENVQCEKQSLQTESTIKSGLKRLPDELQPSSLIPVKRNRSDDNVTCTDEVFDGAYVYGLSAGDRVLVKWDIIQNEDTEDERTIEHWWGATLMAYDGRIYNADENDEDDIDPATEDTKGVEGPIAIHVLEYDAYPEGGFPEKSHEDVIFCSAFELVDVKSHDVMLYKREGDEGMVSVSYNTSQGEGVSSGFEDMVNTVLTNAMNKTLVGGTYEKLPAAAKLLIAEKIANKKAKLVQLMEDFFKTSGKRIGTPKDMKELIEKTMED